MINVELRATVHFSNCGQLWLTILCERLILRYAEHGSTLSLLLREKFTLRTWFYRVTCQPQLHDHQSSKLRTNTYQHCVPWLFAEHVIHSLSGHTSIIVASQPHSRLWLDDHVWSFSRMMCVELRTRSYQMCSVYQTCEKLTFTHTEHTSTVHIISQPPSRLEKGTDCVRSFRIIMWEQKATKMAEQLKCSPSHIDWAEG